MTARKPFFVVPLALQSIAGPAAAGRPASHLGRSKALALTWQNTGGGTVTGTFDGVQPVDFCALISANAKPTTTFRVQVGSFDSGVRPFIDPAVTRLDGLYHSHVEFPLPQATSNWSVTVGHAGVFEGSILVFGKKVEPAKFYDYGVEFGTDDRGSGDIARNGVWNDQSGMILRTLNMTLNWHSESEWENKFRPMVERVGTSQPIYCCFDPQPNAYRQSRTFYGMFRKSPAVLARRKPGLFGGDYQLLSLI